MLAEVSSLLCWLSIYHFSGHASVVKLLPGVDIFLPLNFTVWGKAFVSDLYHVKCNSCISFEESAKLIGCLLEPRELAVDEYICLAKSWLVKLSPPLDVFLSSTYSWASLVAETVKRLPAMQETRVRSLGGEDPLETAMATHSSLLAWRIPRDREDLLEKEMATHSSILVWKVPKSHGQRSLVGYRPWGCTEPDMTQQLTHSLSPALRAWCPPWLPSAFYSRGPFPCLCG